ncbi:MAG: OmpA family protein [Streptosporangiales bacterium]|nr:OmpA family protein [Streptosporangiales bacterium]
MRQATRLLTVATAATAVLVGSSPAAAAPAPRVVELKPRVVELEPRIVDITPKKEKNTYTVDADVLFAFGSAKLTPDAKVVLDDVAGKLDADGARTAAVTGHTDSVGATAYNQRLSTKRARAVRAYLAGKTDGIGYSARGHGEKDPVAANEKAGKDNPAGRKKNRRVTISYAKR